MIRFFLVSFALLGITCANHSPHTGDKKNSPKQEVIYRDKLLTGADQIDTVLALIGGRKTALLVNNTAMLSKTHLADTLLRRGVNLIKIMGPEHGFRGNAADGEVVNNGVDTKTGLPIISLYGNNRKPTAEQLADI